MRLLASGGIPMRYRIIATMLACCWSANAGAQQFAFNRAYVCGGERLVVTACGNDAEPTCTVMYPDRPRPRGFTIQQTERKRDILARLSACANGGGAQARAASQEPALGKAEWHVVTFGGGGGILFTEPLVQPGRSPRGWFTQVNLSAMTYKGQDVWFLQHLTAADCNKRAVNFLETRIFDASGRLIGTMQRNEAPVVRPAPGKVEADELILLCGGETALSKSRPIVADAQGLRSYFQAMAKQIDKTAQAVADYRRKNEPPGEGRNAAQAVQTTASAAPGVRYGSWWIASHTDVKALAFQKPMPPRRAGAKPSGWFTDVYFEARTEQGREYYMVQSLVEADCAANSVTRLSLAYYDLGGQRLLEEKVSPSPTVNPPRDSLAGAQLSLLCGRPYELAMPEPFKGNASALWDFATSIKEAEERQRLEKK
jgi:hypothetical protein